MSRSDFIAQLHELGYQVEDKGENRLAFRYTVPVGRFVGQEIMLGLIVGDEFPATPPSGPHISLRLLPLNNSNVPPDGGINTSPFGDEWEYWSRPFNEWSSTDRTVRAYLSHIRRLFAALC